MYSHFDTFKKCGLMGNLIFHDQTNCLYFKSVSERLNETVANLAYVIFPQEVVGKKGNGFTWVMLAQGIGCVCGPVVGGLIYDASGSYRLAFEIASTMACISATLSVLAAISRHSKER